MAKVAKVLGQSAPAATTETTLYTVPNATVAVISSLSICNRDGSTAEDARVAVRPKGAKLANEHYILYDYNVATNDRVAIGSGMTLNSGDVVTVRSANGTLSFSLFGVESTLQ